MFSHIHNTELTFIILVGLVAGLAALAQRWKTPYPIVLVLGGLVLSFFSFIPHVSMHPTFVFLVILPPLLFASALNTAWREFRFNLVSISMLGVGMVAFTVAGVSIVAHLFMPEFDWRTGAVLGAVVSTTDAIAVAAIARSVGLPHLLLEIIEGESLINDAAGLLALQFTTDLVVSGEIPSLGAGAREFVWLVIGGIAAGLLVGWFVAHFERMLLRQFQNSSEVPILVSVATPYMAYLLGEGIHASGVLATVVCGLYIGRMTSEAFSTRARLDGSIIWNTIDFILNGLVFIVIGLQLPVVLDAMRARSGGGLNWPHLIAGSLLVAAVVIGVRMVLVFPGSHFAYFIRKRILRQQIAAPVGRHLFITGWAGMRGVLTLAAALSLPEAIASGENFPQRGRIIFYAFAVILITLVGQGLSLPFFIRRLHVAEDSDAMDEERKARRVLIKAALKALQELPPQENDGDDGITPALTRFYERRLESLKPDVSESAQQQEREYLQLAARIRSVEREQITRLRNEGCFRESTLRDLERELDLLDLRWEAK